MRALAVLATLSVTGCSRDCASRSAKAEARKGTSALERTTERGHEGMPETVKYVAANENRLIAVATQVRGFVTALPAGRGARVFKGNPLLAQSAQRTLRDAEVEELAAGLDLGRASVEIDRIGGRYVEAGEKR
jgi:hypothetical protein